MRPARIIPTVVFAAALAVTGCAAHATAVGPPVASAPPVTHPPPTNSAPIPHPQPPPDDPTGSAPAPTDRRAAIYATVLRQYLTSGDSSFSRRFPRIFVLDHAVAGTGTPPRAATATGAGRLPPAARRMITDALADVGPVVFVPSPDAVIVGRGGCARVRKEGILITLGPLAGVGDRVEVGINGFVACLGASSATYVVGWTGERWVVRQTTLGPVA